ncbi:MAG: alpha/beta hydrolase fold protein [Caulobacter sp.]|nr:alpha/beta hydrolase fold protein [Caulobacter sp.]
MDRQTPFAEDETLPGRSLEPWLNESAALTDLLRTGSRAFAKGLGGPTTAFALVRAERLGVAVVDRLGKPLFANAAWRQVFDTSPPDRTVLAGVIAEGGRRTVLIDHGEASAGRSTALYAAVPLTRDWALPREAMDRLDDKRAAAVIVVVGALSAAQVLADVCKAFGLTDLQTRIAIGLVRTGDVRGAAQQAGVSYQTGRKVAFDAMRRVGAPRITGFIERLVRLSFGVWPQGEAGAAELTDIWGLSPRQARLALCIAEGMTRAEAAAAAGISEATAKKALEVVFDVMGVRSAAGLARAVTEARALALITDATHGEAQLDSDTVEPLNLFLRPDGSQVAYSDYGPRSGRPVLVLHSSSASRPAPSRLVAALQAEGFRPLSLDRPGFGLTDPHPDKARARAAPFDAAIDDVRLFLRHLKLDRVDVVARGGAQVAVAMARLAPELMGRVLLINPDPSSASHNRRRGPVGALQEAYLRHPDLIEGLVKLIVANLSTDQSRRIMLKAVEGSPLDLATFSDPRNLADYRRGFRLFATGRVAGYVAEQTAIGRWTSPPLGGAAHWRVLLSRHDFLHDPERTFAVWREILPEARFDWVEDASRFLAMSHGALIARALAESEAPPQG